VKLLKILPIINPVIIPEKIANSRKEIRKVGTRAVSIGGAWWR
jgi:hypothetical protein